MNTVRLNITLPSDIAEAIKGIKNKSAFIADVLKERLEREKRKRLVNALRDGYMATREEDKKLATEWDSTSGDGID